MPDEKTWWEKLPEPFASIKGNALWSAICIVVGSCVSAFFTSKIFNQSIVIAAYIALALTGVAFLVGGIVSFLRNRANKAAVEGICSVVMSDCVYLLKLYKRLDYEARERVRNPLHKSAVPDFGKPWDLYAAELYSARDNFSILTLKVHGLWTSIGRKKEPAITRLPDTAVMLDVIESLEELLNELREIKNSDRLRPE